MDCAHAMLADQRPLSSQMKAAESNVNATHKSFQRRSANYKPNIWKYDLLQSLKTEYTEEKYKSHVEKLKEEVTSMLVEAVDQLVKLELIDNIQKLGLANLFELQIKETLDTIVSTKNKKPSTEDQDLYAAALRFRLLRQHGYSVSQDMFQGFMDEKGTFMKHTGDVKAMLELFEASHLALESEEMLDVAKAFSARILKNMISSNNLNDKLAKQLAHAIDLPLHWRVEWYDARRQIRACENEDETNSIVLELAKINFNMIQAAHQKDLRGIARWWRNLGLVENLSFTRDRLVESYLWAVGVAFEPNHKSFRKWLTKAINFVITIDDVYDIYGSLEELECFTNAIDRWDCKKIEQLPECMKICFEALCTTINEVANEVEKEKGWKVLPHIKKAWADFCKALLVEAKWYNEGYTPSLQEYLDNGWISSSGPILSLHALFSSLEPTDEVLDYLASGQDLVRYTSLIIRLCNDMGTSTAELERGDASSSILCFMREANVSEEIARKHIRSMIKETWKKINSECITQSLSLQPFVKYRTNTARVAHFIYQHGDGFGVQDRETRDLVLALLIEPLTLN